jgi:NAD(P)-dependent dehydrogenase (short-subunit alcohol dehydrogenase family)
VTRLQGNVALITGGTSGIGEATAVRFAAEGATVAIAGRDRERGQRVTDQLDDLGGKSLFVTGDVADESEVGELVDQVVERLGRIDVLVNNAGIINFGTVVDARVDEWDRLMATNVRGVFLVSRAVLPHMIAQGGGSVVNVGSNLGLVGTRNAAAYTASKGAVIQLTRAMALDHVDAGIRVNCICPGTIETPLVQRQRIGRTEEQMRQAAERTKLRFPVGRIGTPEEVAGLLTYLASDEASFVTGAVFSVDGGYTTQ